MKVICLRRIRAARSFLFPIRQCWQRDLFICSSSLARCTFFSSIQTSSKSCHKCLAAWPALVIRLPRVLPSHLKYSESDRASHFSSHWHAHQCARPTFFILEERWKLFVLLRADWREVAVATPGSRWPELSCCSSAPAMRGRPKIWLSQALAVVSPMLHQLRPVSRTWFARPNRIIPT